VIVIVLLLLTLQSVALTVVEEGTAALLLIVPILLLNVSTLVSAGVQVTIVETSTPDWLPTSAVAVNVIAVPGGPLVASALMVRLVTAGHTVTVALVVDVIAPSLAEIVVVPIVVAVLEAWTRPLFVPTVATAGSEEVHTHLLVTVSVLPSLKVPVAII